MVLKVLPVDLRIDQGLQYLNADMESYPAFDPSASYEEKNYYVNRANQHGLQLLRVGAFSLAEIYYEVLLDRILEFEIHTNKRFNKGIVYANLAISLIAQHKYDEGVPCLLEAQREDREHCTQKSFSILDSRLWTQYEQLIVVFLAKYQKPNYVFVIDTQLIHNLFTKLDAGDNADRVFLAVSLLRLSRNL